MTSAYRAMPNRVIAQIGRAPADTNPMDPSLARPAEPSCAVTGGMMGPAQTQWSMVRSDVLGLLLTLRPGTYSFNDLSASLTAALDRNAVDLLELAIAEGYLTWLAPSTIDSDGHDTGDRLVTVNPEGLVADAIYLPNGPVLDIDPLPSEVLIPSVRARGAPARRQRKKRGAASPG